MLQIDTCQKQEFSFREGAEAGLDIFRQTSDTAAQGFNVASHYVVPHSSVGESASVIKCTGQSYRFEDPYRIFAPNITQGPEGFPECEDLGSRRVLNVDF